MSPLPTHTTKASELPCTDPFSPSPFPIRPEAIKPNSPSRSPHDCESFRPSPSLPFVPPCPYDRNSVEDDYRCVPSTSRANYSSLPECTSFLSDLIRKFVDVSRGYFAIPPQTFRLLIRANRGKLFVTQLTPLRQCWLIPSRACRMGSLLRAGQDPL